MTSLETSLPLRGKRPRNRRELIVRAAADLFYRVGYPQVTMADVAAAVGVGPSALYRHFAGKQELLVAAVSQALRPYAEIVTADLDTTIERLAAAAVEERRAGVLWQRESRHLPAADRAVLRESVRAGVLAFARLLEESRTQTQAEFLAWCDFSVLTSPSYHRLELPSADYQELLADMSREVSTVELPEIEYGQESVNEQRVEPRSRREALLRTAAVMFAENGYGTASLQEIGAGVEIAGPSIYHHFDSKLDLLVALMNRGAEWLRRDMSSELAAASDPADALSRLLRSYAGFALAHRELVDILITEVAQLPGPDRHRTRQIQRDYVAEWVHLLRSVHSDLAEVPARIRVQATLTVINDIARTTQLRRAKNVDAALHAVGGALLGLPVSAAGHS
ncbi:TetR/AcrR family transcriptional regulator [Fodinicola feengrottensis]|uniref:TetR/AcrR family transcriptional regulator n=1 Tax=Fodinicola feengrottensis TaxID=435914 RepID=A0ABN2FQ49_9ACTN